MFKTKIDRFEILSICVKMVELLHFKVICHIKQKQLGSFFPCMHYLHIQLEKRKKPVKNDVHKSG